MIQHETATLECAFSFRLVPLFLKICLAPFCWLDGPSGWCYSSWDAQRPPKMAVNSWHVVSFACRGLQFLLSFLDMRDTSVPKVGWFWTHIFVHVLKYRTSPICQKWPLTSTTLKPPMSKVPLGQCQSLGALPWFAAGVGLVGRKRGSWEISFPRPEQIVSTEFVDRPTVLKLCSNEKGWYTGIYMEFCVTHTLTWNFVLHIHLQRYTPFCIYGYMHIQTRAHTGLNTRTHRDIHTWYAHMHIHALKDMFADLCVFFSGVECTSYLCAI